MATRSCFLPSCEKSGPLLTFKVQAVRKLLESATDRNDDEKKTRIQGVVGMEGDDVSLQLHKRCYYSYTSRHVGNFLARKRKDDLSSNECEPPSGRIRRSQVVNFDFKQQCLVCALPCLALRRS